MTTSTLPFLAQPDLNLILTGYTGPNQPFIGHQLAARLRLKYINVDTLIEDRAEMDIEDFRQRFGETRLRTLEAEIMEDVMLNRGTLIRIGGQTLLNGDHNHRLQATGPVICLVASLDAVLRRIHMALGARYHSPHERALAIGSLKREWAVRRLEGVHELDATYMNEEEIVSAAIQLWQNLALVSL